MCFHEVCSEIPYGKGGKLVCQKFAVRLDNPAHKIRHYREKSGRKVALPLGLRFPLKIWPVMILHLRSERPLGPWALICWRRLAWIEEQPKSERNNVSNC